MNVPFDEEKSEWEQRATKKMLILNVTYLLT